MARLMGGTAGLARQTQQQGPRRAWWSTWRCWAKDASACVALLANSQLCADAACAVQSLQAIGHVAVGADKALVELRRGVEDCMASVHAAQSQHEVRARHWLRVRCRRGCS